MTRKSYDDDLLLELLTDGTSTHTQIAQRVGISVRTVDAIAEGRLRKGLQARLTELRSQRGLLPPGTRRRQYDDEVLVTLLAGGQLNYREVAHRVGISATMVAEIDHGRVRKDLQPRLARRRRRRLKQLRQRGIFAMCEEQSIPTDPVPTHREARGAGPSSPSRQRSCRYDDDRMVELIATPGISHAQIAEQLGCRTATVWSIATGRSRRDLQPRIREAMTVTHTEARRHALKYLMAMLSVHTRTGLEEAGEAARKCREFIIKMAMEEPANEIGPVECETCVYRSRRGLSDLPEPLLSQALEALGGPTEEDAECGFRIEKKL